MAGNEPLAFCADEVDAAEWSLEPQAAFDYAYKLIVAQAQAGGMLDKAAVIILHRLGRPLGLKPADIIDRLLADIIIRKGLLQQIRSFSLGWNHHCGA